VSSVEDAIVDFLGFQEGFDQKGNDGAGKKAAVVPKWVGGIRTQVRRR
jgi:hypothetical protein